MLFGPVSKPAFPGKLMVMDCAEISRVLPEAHWSVPPRKLITEMALGDRGSVESDVKLSAPAFRLSVPMRLFAPRRSRAPAPVFARPFELTIGALTVA